jgi:hypothetical protein
VPAVFRLHLDRLLLALASLAICGLSAAYAASAAPGASPPRVWAVAGTGLYPPHPIPFCRLGFRCGVGDRATDATFDDTEAAGTVVHLDRQGRLYLNQRGSDSSAPVVRVGLNGRIDLVEPLERTPDNIAIGPLGEIYYTNADDDDQTVWKWSPTTHKSMRFAGRTPVTTNDAAPCGQEGDTVTVCPVDEGKPALRVLLHGVNSLAVDPEGRLLIADGEHFLVRRVEHDGTISTIAGTGVDCFGDCSTPGLPASRTEISPPSFVTAGRDGSIWFTVGRALYRVSPTGAFHLVFFPNTHRPLSAPAIDKAGNAIVGYWPAGERALLVRITPAGVVTRLLGRQTSCNFLREGLECGDGSFATSAAVGREVTSVAVAPNGDIYFSDEGGEVRYIPTPRARRPARLGLAVSAAAKTSSGGRLRIAFRTNASATVSLIVAGHGRAKTETATARTLGSLIWHEDANGKTLAAGHYTLQIIATDEHGRSASRALPVEITTG